MTATNLLSQAVLNALFARTSSLGAFTSPPDLHLAASTSTPTDAGANFTEPGAGVNYSRLDVSNTDFLDATLANPSLLENGAALTFPTASGAGWGVITHVGLFNAASGGDLLIFYALTVAQTINDANTLSFSAGEFETTLT